MENPRYDAYYGTGPHRVCAWQHPWTRVQCNKQYEQWSHTNGQEAWSVCEEHAPIYEPRKRRKKRHGE